MNELKHELIELLNKYDLTISEFDELTRFMQSVKDKATLTFEFNEGNIENLEQDTYTIANCTIDTRPVTQKTWLT